MTVEIGCVLNVAAGAGGLTQRTVRLLTAAVLFLQHEGLRDALAAVRVDAIGQDAGLAKGGHANAAGQRFAHVFEFRAQGAEEAEKIQADADRQRVEIVADAYREAEKLRGEGDARAAEVYASAFEQNADFYGFWRSLMT